MDDWLYTIYIDHLQDGKPVRQIRNIIVWDDNFFEFFDDGRSIWRGKDWITECYFETMYDKYGKITNEIVWSKIGWKYSEGYIDKNGNWKMSFFDD